MSTFVSHMASIVAVLAYALGSVLYIRMLSPHATVRTKLARVALISGFFCHLVFLLITDWQSSEAVARLPYMLSLISLVLVGLFILLERRYAIAGLGGFVAPLSLLFMVFSAFLFHLAQTGEAVTERSVLLSIHWICAALAYVMFIFAFGVSSALIFQESLLKRKHLLRMLQRLPSLVFLDRFNRWLLLIGFLLLNIGVIAGIAFAQEEAMAMHMYQAVLFWIAPAMIVYGLLVGAIFLRGLRGRRAAWLSVVGFLAVMLSFLGSGISSGRFHVY